MNTVAGALFGFAMGCYALALLVALSPAPPLPIQWGIAVILCGGGAAAGGYSMRRFW